MQQAHVLLRRFGGDRRNDGTQKHLGKSRGHGKDHGSEQQSRVGVVGEEGWRECVDQKPRRGDQRHDPNDLTHVETL